MRAYSIPNQRGDSKIEKGRDKLVTAWKTEFWGIEEEVKVCKHTFNQKNAEIGKIESGGNNTSQPFYWAGKMSQTNGVCVPSPPPLPKGEKKVWFQQALNKGAP